MPLVGLADLGALATAALALLCAIAFDYIIRAIASQLPNVGILTFTLKLGDMFKNAASGVLDWLVNQTADLWNDFSKWVLAHAYLIDQFAGAVVQAIVTHADYIAHIVTDAIPNAIRATESYVGTELVKLEHTLKTDISKAVSSAETLLSGDIKSLAGTLSGDVQTLDTDISRGITKAVSTAENYTDNAIQTLRDYVDKAVSDAETQASQALNKVTTQLGNAISGVASTAANELTSAENTLENQIANASRTAASDLASAEQTLGGEITAGEQAASTALSQTVAALGGEITSAEQTLQGQIGSAVGTLTTDVGTIGQTINGDLANVQPMLQAMIAASIAGVISRVATLEECSVGVCEDSPNNFSNLLQDALGLVSLAGVGAFLAEVINSPAQAEGEYADVIQGTFQTGEAAFQALLSVGSSIF